MSKFLDNTGLQYLWGKIKSWADGRFLKKSGGTLTGNLTVQGSKGNIKLENDASLGPMLSAQYMDMATSNIFALSVYLDPSNKCLSIIPPTGANYAFGFGNKRIGGVATPVEGTDGANKTYVDTAVAEAGGGFEVGDILISTRTDLGDEWLLCNGANIDRADYPEYSEKFSIAAALSGDTWTYDDVATGIDYIDSETGKVKYLNGYYILCVGQTDTYRPDAVIYYSTNPNGPWTEVMIKEHNGNYTYFCKDIAYGGGRYVAAVRRKYNTDDDSSTDAYIYYATSLDGPWTEKAVYDVSGVSADVTSIEYLSNYFVVTGTSYETGAETPCTAWLSYASTPSGTWGRRVIWKSNRDCSINGIIKLLTRYFIFGKQGNECVYAYAASPTTNSWTTVTLTSYSGYDIKAMLYNNSRYVMAISNLDDVTVLTSTSYSSSSSWTDKGSGISITDAHGMVYVDGVYVILGTHGRYISICFTENISSPSWTLKDLYNDSDSYPTPSGILYVNDRLLILGNTGNANRIRLSLLDNSTVPLPTLTGDSVYYYLKAK